MRTNIKSGSPYEDVFGYCRAVRVGNVIHVAGTVAQLPDLDQRNAYEQAVSALDVIQAALAEVGADRYDVVRTITYVTDIGDMELVARAHGAVFADVRPGSTLVEVSALIDPAMKVEIEVYAVIDPDRDRSAGADPLASTETRIMG